MSVSLNMFQQGEIYVDTMVFYILLRAEQRVRPTIRDFFARIETGRIMAFTSGLTFDELAYRLLLALIKDRYGGSPLEHLRDREVALLQELSPVVIPKLQLLQRFPHLHLVEITSQDIRVMLQNMLEYPLRPRDALHLATMQRLNCLNLASNDQHFDVVPGIQRFSIDVV
ncbi:MAG: PIN domain-containing protein [Nitrospinota bacterium]|nr:MAG: PIN domain-containing protein [Nitrospinota bacterium]